MENERNRIAIVGFSIGYVGGQSTGIYRLDLNLKICSLDSATPSPPHAHPNCQVQPGLHVSRETFVLLPILGSTHSGTPRFIEESAISRLVRGLGKRAIARLKAQTLPQNILKICEKIILAH